jgi:predicted metal-dependent hydrolase
MAAIDFTDPRIDEGIRLFNEGDYFECHDVLEDFWTEQTGPEKPLFQGLIQAAVAMFHFGEGNLGGARRMSLSSRVYLSPFAPETAGIDVAGLLSQMAHCFEKLWEPHTSYPGHLRLDPERVPKIRRLGNEQI